MKISCIGSGNVAWHLTQILELKGHQIAEVYSRNPNHAENLSKQLEDALPTTSLNFEKSEAELLLLAVSDDALPDLVKQLKSAKKQILVHTSGSRSMDVFKGVKNPFGVFYPLQTFSKNKPLEFSEVPFCIEASDENTEKLLLDLAASLSSRVYAVNSEQRKKLHLAAVISCNFSNHLLARAEELLKAENLDFEILKPLIRETFEKALVLSPRDVQTGPAKRKDHQILEDHLRMLSNNPTLKKIYKLLSESIPEMYS